MVRVLKGSYSFSCTPRVHPLTWLTYKVACAVLVVCYDLRGWRGVMVI